jgi:hypothetical protein
MQRSGVEDAVGSDHIYTRVQDGVDDFLARQGQDTATNEEEE